MKTPNSVYKSVLTAPRFIRLLVGLLLIVGGVFGFLPVLGFWMIPLGLLVIFFDVPWVGEMWRRARAYWRQRRNAHSDSRRQ